MKRRTLAALAIATLAATACGEQDKGRTITDPTWTITTDPYGREHACLYVDGDYAATLYCTPAP